MAKRISKNELQKILGDKKLRKWLAHEDPLWFALIYLGHYFNYQFAPFHIEMFNILRDERYKMITVMAFRGSGKSTILNTANILWSILGKPQNKFVVIVSQSQDQAKNHFNNIKEELLNNELLREDFGPFSDDEKEWRKMSLELTYREAKILSISKEQSIRGIKHKSARPDLVIGDDLEDDSMKLDDNERNKLYTRFMSEVMPLGDENTRIVVLGNLICEDSLLMKLKDVKRNDGIFRVYPIIDNDRKLLWKEKFHNIEEIKKLQKKFPIDVWVKEFLLKNISFNDDGEMPHPIYSRRESREGGGKWSMNLLTQKPLIPPMEEFNIFQPSKYYTIPIFPTMDESIEYLRFIENLNLGEPMISPEEKLLEIIEKTNIIGK